MAESNIERKGAMFRFTLPAITQSDSYHWSWLDHFYYSENNLGLTNGFFYLLKQDDIASDIVDMDYWKLFSLVSWLSYWLWDIMLRIIKADKVNWVVKLEMSKRDLENIVQSVDSMSDKQQRILLENLPSEDQDRQKLDDYKALREELRKILQVLINWLIY